MKNLVLLIEVVLISMMPVQIKWMTKPINCKYMCCPYVCHPNGNTILCDKWETGQGARTSDINLGCPRQSNFMVTLSKCDT